MACIRKTRQSEHPDYLRIHTHVNMITRCLVASSAAASEQNLLHNRAEHNALVLVCYAATPLESAISSVYNTQAAHLKFR